MRAFEDFVVGETTDGGSLPVSQDDILAYATRFDAQTFHTDPEAAKASFVGTLIASGWHSCALLMRLIAGDLLAGSTGMGAPGIDEVRWLRPVKPGDVLSSRRTVLETKASRSRPEMGLVRFRFELTNQRGEPVLDQTNWIMFGRSGSGRAQPAGDWLSHPVRYVRPDRESPLEAPAAPASPARFFDEIVAFARAFDPQPFHLDEDAAAASSFGRLAASGWHTGSMWMAAMVSHRRRQEAVFRSVEAGEPPRLGPSPGFKNLKWSKPVYAGDRITYHSEIVDKRASASRPQWGLFFHRNTGVNQAGEEAFVFEGCAFVERR